MQNSFPGLLFATVLLLLSAGANASYSELFVFGDSLSDSGNNATILPDRTPTPISGNSFIPTDPYASGHYTNGQVWAQDLASALGLSANPLLQGGTDYAFGGARTGPIDAPPSPSLEAQTALFLTQNSDSAPSNALYVVAGGGNDARDALVAMEACTTNACINNAIVNAAASYATNIETIVAGLEAAGAKHIVVWDTPDIGITPAVLSSGLTASNLGTLVASTMNAALVAGLGAGNADIFNLFGLLDDIVGKKGKGYGLTNVTDACAQYVDCNPSNYLFWDGIHPTSAGQQIIANAMLKLVSVAEPSSMVLLVLGLVSLLVNYRKSKPVNRG